MIEWLKDLLGINRYVLAWKIRWPNGELYIGDTRNHRYIGFFTRKSASRLAGEMNAAYGAATHWIMRV